MYSIDKTIHYNDDTQCNSIALRKGTNHLSPHTDYRMIPDRLNHLLKFNSDNNTESTLTISVYDLQGRCVQQSVASGIKSVYSINFNQQSEQFYLIKLTDEKNYEKTFKLVW